MKRICFCAVLAFVAVSGFAVAEKPDVLNGLLGVTVLIEGLDPDLERAGLNATMLKTDMELRLRQHNIHIFKNNDSDGIEKYIAAGIPRLYVNLNKIRLSSGSFVWALSIELRELVFLYRRDSTFAQRGMTPEQAKERGAYSANTWDSGHLGLTSDPNKMRQSVRDLTDQFINDYLAANPKQ